MLKVGIAGYGIVGKRRRECIDRHPEMDVIAVCDKEFSKKGVFEDGIRFYQNYTDLIFEKLDVLFVCLTNDIAPEATIAGLRNGIHVFCEKPPGRNIRDIISVIEEEKKHSNLKIMYGFNHRYHESVKDALRIIRSKNLGKI